MPHRQRQVVQTARTPQHRRKRVALPPPLTPQPKVRRSNNRTPQIVPYHPKKPTSKHLHTPRSRGTSQRAVSRALYSRQLQLKKSLSRSSQTKIEESKTNRSTPPRPTQRKLSPRRNFNIRKSQAPKSPERRLDCQISPTPYVHSDSSKSPQLRSDPSKSGPRHGYDSAKSESASRIIALPCGHDRARSPNRLKSEPPLSARAVHVSTVSFIRDPYARFRLS